MTEQDLITPLKVDLGITTTKYDERFLQLIAFAMAEIQREGATLDLSQFDHCNIVVMYAAWIWRKRDTQEGMPRMLRYALNNLVFSQKVGDTDG